MKILFPQEYLYPSQIGGPANTIYWHTGYLSKKDIDVSIVTSTIGIPSSYSVRNDRWVHDGHRKIRYCRGGRVSWRILWYSLKELPSTDIVHFSSICYPWNIFLCFIAVLFQKRILISPRGELFPSAYRRKKVLKKCLFACYRMLGREILFHATSEDEKMAICKIFPGNEVIILPNFIEVNYATYPINRSNDIIFLGRINRIKNIHVLIDSLVLSSGFMNSGGKLMIVGKSRLEDEHSYFEELKCQVISLGLQERVIFCGQMEGSHKNTLINKCKVLVLPSQSENFGNVVIEAMSQSVPVIASKGTPWSVLNEEGLGWWVESNETEIGKALDSLYSLQQTDYYEMCKQCKAYVEREYDINLSEKNRWVEIYNKIKNK